MEAPQVQYPRSVGHLSSQELEPRLGPRLAGPCPQSVPRRLPQQGAGPVPRAGYPRSPPHALSAFHNPTAVLRRQLAPRVSGTPGHLPDRLGRPPQSGRFPHSSLPQPAPTLMQLATAPSPRCNCRGPWLPPMMGPCSDLPRPAPECAASGSGAPRRRPARVPHASGTPARRPASAPAGCGPASSTSGSGRQTPGSSAGACTCISPALAAACARAACTPAPRPPG